MGNYLLKNGTIINRGKRVAADVLIRKERIERIDSIVEFKGRVTEIDCTDRWILPGLIDDQVHFREPGLTHKATIASESRAALAGGVTSFMEMPNTKPPAFTQTLLEEKYEIASRTSAANYSFYMGTSNDNLEEVLKTDPKSVCGVKIFMGSSTGNLLVDNPRTLERLFGEVPMLIATHCEDEEMIKANLEDAIRKYGKAMPPSAHAVIRSRQSCLKSSSFAVSLAKKYGTRLHILHISTKEETMLFDADIPLAHKRITSEACVHHMSFSDKDYVTLGNKIKCNPAIKTEHDRTAIVEAVRNGRIDVIATDHAPHTKEEKAGDYLNAPSGLPLVQHSLPLLLNLHHRNELPIEIAVERACHAPAMCFLVRDRGFLDEGKYADVVVVDPARSWKVTQPSLLYLCGWSPLEGMDMHGKIEKTFVNGNIVWDGVRIVEGLIGERLTFER
ncbi:MAG TPA: dihydroorotase [Saprospiraceae bacterium]|nr:dihydroorotase [Saprospiraceae bacterium]